MSYPSLLKKLSGFTLTLIIRSPEGPPLSSRLPYKNKSKLNSPHFPSLTFKGTLRAWPDATPDGILISSSVREYAEPVPLQGVHGVLIIEPVPLHF